MPNKIQIFDTTLRDGTQAEHINFTAQEKVLIAKKLDQLGIDYIEGGWPGSNPKDQTFFKLARSIEFKNSLLTAFGSTRKKGVKASQDPNLKALIQSQAPALIIFGKTWDLHVKKVMKNSLQENLNMIYESITYLVSSKRQVLYDAEHFFDGYKANPDYAIKTLEQAAQAKAHTLVLCDTNGGGLPSQIKKITQEAIQRIKSKYPKIGFAIHAHNDSGLAVANSIAAVEAGASMVQGTINGYGERCGNADLTTIIPILELKMNHKTIGSRKLKKLKSVSRYISELANEVPVKNRPFVGSSAFAHKGGIHVSAVMKTSQAYEHINPELIGNQRRVIVSDLAGKSNIEYKAKELGLSLNNQNLSRRIASKIKALENQGYQYDGAEGSLKVLMQKLSGKINLAFQLRSFRVTIEKDENSACVAHAIVKIAVNDQVEITASEGDGPVSALDGALRKALKKFYPSIDKMRLLDFKVRVIDGKLGTSAKVRVLIESGNGKAIWNTIGVSEDIIEASWQALADSFYYFFSQNPSKFNKH
ncbi:MAG: citramalate synthase [Candidatus Moranbacteria bacterium]|nr:citramalate synthase [Candidatus Moranbacteria bacterium]